MEVNKMNFDQMKKTIEDAEKLRDHIRKCQAEVAATSAFMAAFAISGVVTFVVTLAILT